MRQEIARSVRNRPRAAMLSLYVGALPYGLVEDPERHLRDAWALTRAARAEWALSHCESMPAQMAADLDLVEEWVILYMMSLRVDIETELKRGRDAAAAAAARAQARAEGKGKGSTGAAGDALQGNVDAADSAERGVDGEDSTLQELTQQMARLEPAEEDHFASGNLDKILEHKWAREYPSECEIQCLSHIFASICFEADLGADGFDAGKPPERPLVDHTWWMTYPLPESLQKFQDEYDAKYH